LVETRAFDSRYFPASIEVEASGDPRSWIYTTDNVGNVEAIEQTVDCTTSRLIDGETLDTDQTLTACCARTSLWAQAPRFWRLRS
jgi:hypothetical protein